MFSRILHDLPQQVELNELVEKDYDTVEQQLNRPWGEILQQLQFPRSRMKIQPRMFPVLPAIAVCFYAIKQSIRFPV